MDDRTLARIGIFSALSVVGSFINTPSPLPSIALDSAPGFFSALKFTSIEGALILMVGHLATATVHGFPLGLIHLPIALLMFLIGLLMGYTSKISVRFACILGVGINTIGVLILTPFWGFLPSLAIMPFLLFASSLNMALAFLTYRVIKRENL